MKKVFVIGIGAGNPDYVTIQAVNALNEVDVFFVLDKGQEKDDLVRLRKDICERFIREPSYRIVEVPNPVRRKSDPSYKPDVEAWRQQRAAIFKSLIGKELKDGECGAFLVWGDPSIYDGTLRILQDILADGSVAFDYEVIPGISSVQALAARHRIALNRIGEAIQITTGRRLAEGFPDKVENVVVMLDADSGLKSVEDDELEIFWGAYVGTADEVLVSGKLKERRDDILRLRQTKKAEKGWIMDTYLLRRAARD